MVPESTVRRSDGLQYQTASQLGHWCLFSPARGLPRAPQDLAWWPEGSGGGESTPRGASLKQEGVRAKGSICQPAGGLISRGAPQLLRGPPVAHSLLPFALDLIGISPLPVSHAHMCPGLTSRHPGLPYRRVSVLCCGGNPRETKPVLQSQLQHP